MNTYKIQDREAGNFIEGGLTYLEALNRVNEYEIQDIEEDIYTPNFYEIVAENYAVINEDGKYWDYYDERWKSECDDQCVYDKEWAKRIAEFRNGKVVEL